MRNLSRRSTLSLPLVLAAEAAPEAASPGREAPPAEEEKLKYCKFC